MSDGFEESNDILGGGEDLDLPGLQSELTLAIAASPCDQGEEKDVTFIDVRQGQRVNLRVVLCNALFRVRVLRNATVIFDEENLRDEVNVPVEGLTPGSHRLIWGFLAASSPWTTRSEVSVDDTIEFCLRKGHRSSFTSNQLAVFLQVT